MGDMGGEGDVRDIVEIGIGTCLTVFLVTVADLVTEQIIEMLSHLKKETKNLLKLFGSDM